MNRERFVNTDPAIASSDTFRLRSSGQRPDPQSARAASASSDRTIASPSDALLGSEPVDDCGVEPVCTAGQRLSPSPTQAAANTYACTPQQRPVGTFEPGAEGLDGALVQLTVLHEFREVVVEAGVNRAGRHGGSAAQALEIRKMAAMHLGGGGFNELSARLGTAQTDYMMPRSN